MPINIWTGWGKKRKKVRHFQRNVRNAESWNAGGGFSDSPRGLWEARAAAPFSDLPLQQHFVPNASRCSGWEAGGAEAALAVTWANSDTQGFISTVNPFFNLLPHAARKSFQGLALFCSWITTLIEKEVIFCWSNFINRNPVYRCTETKLD